ncbi:MAG: sugar-binding transcriptional regulator [Firmicutes bacterium]|nr:sugar-binding transcriptional regulator [Bacillota bacterium]
MYYEFGYIQEVIAEKEGISRSSVSRILDKAYKEGIIQIKVVYPLQPVRDLEESLKAHFNLKKVFVVPMIIDHPDAVRNDLGIAVAGFLKEIITDGEIIGVSWGTTLPYVTHNMGIIPKQRITVVQLNGGVAKNYLSTQSGAIVEGFVQAFNAVPYMLPVPAIVDSVDLAAAIAADSNVKQTLDLARQARIALFGIGRASNESILVKAGYFCQGEYEDLLNKGAVGDICSRYFKIDGSIADTELYNRTVGISLEELAVKDYSIAVANGEEKAEAILGALRGGYVNTLFIDECAARKCLSLL